MITPYSGRNKVHLSPADLGFIKQAVRDASISDNPVSVEIYSQRHATMLQAIAHRLREELIDADSISSLHDDIRNESASIKKHLDKLEAEVCGPFSDLNETDRRSRRPEERRSNPVGRGACDVHTTASTDGILDSLKDSIDHSLLERPHRLAIELDVPLLHAFTSLLCVGVGTIIASLGITYQKRTSNE